MSCLRYYKLLCLTLFFFFLLLYFLYPLAFSMCHNSKNWLRKFFTRIPLAASSQREFSAGRLWPEASSLALGDSLTGWSNYTRFNLASSEFFTSFLKHGSAKPIATLSLHTPVMTSQVLRLKRNFCFLKYIKNPRIHVSIISAGNVTPLMARECPSTPTNGCPEGVRAVLPGRDVEDYGTPQVPAASDEQECAMSCQQ